jgi:hypothetical protein
MENKFYQFSRLPLELRRKTWRHAVLDCRFIVELNVAYNKISPLYSPSAVFSVNRESREEAIKTSTQFSFYSGDVDSKFPDIDKL